MAGLAMVSIYNFLLQRCSWDPEIETMLLDGLAGVSDEPWSKIGEDLLAHSKTVLTAAGANDDDKAQS